MLTGRSRATRLAQIVGPEATIRAWPRSRRRRLLETDEILESANISAIVLLLYGVEEPGIRAIMRTRNVQGRRSIYPQRRRSACRDGREIIGPVLSSRRVAKVTKLNRFIEQLKEPNHLGRRHERRAEMSYTDWDWTTPPHLSRAKAAVASARRGKLAVGFRCMEKSIAEFRSLRAL